MAKHYYGNGKPVNVYRNQVKLAGYHTETKSGDSVSFDCTYNDVADVELTGNTVQMSDWYAKDGLSSQVQEPVITNFCRDGDLQNSNNPEQVVGNSSLAYDSFTINSVLYNGLTLTQALTADMIGIDISIDQMDLKANDCTVSFFMNATRSGNLLKGSIRVLVDNVPYFLDNISQWTTTEVEFTKYTSSYLPEDLNTWKLISFTIPKVTFGSSVTSVRLLPIRRNTGSFVAKICNFKVEQVVGSRPSPDYPSAITSNLAAGTYKTTYPNGDIYEFILTEELRGIGTSLDKVVFDRKSHRGYLERRNGKKVYDGTETFNNQSGSYDTTNRMLFSHILSIPLDMPSRKGVCTHFNSYSGSVQSISVDVTAFNFNSNAIYSDYIYFKIDKNLLSSQDATGFKSLLTTQYSAGTPVTVVYQLATPTRTPLTFTKVSSSSAPECPMTFLTNTPSLDYPADVVDASGNVVSNGAVVGVFPALRSIGDI